MKRRLWLLGMLVLLLGLTACSGVAGSKQGVLSLESLDGQIVDLADYQGQIVLVNFWATWCGPCRVEMPELQAYYQAHADNPAFAMLSINRGETRDTAQTYIDEGNYTFPVVLDPDDAAAAYFGGVRGMPTTLVLDENGEVVYQHVGLLNREVLEEHVTPLFTDING